jgi:phosphonopyruvate decarboxylase
MLYASSIVNYFSQLGFGPYIGVPCSFLKPLLNYLIDHCPEEYLAVNNEGEAIAVASGAYLAGRRPVVLFQNSGLGNAVNPLTSLSSVFNLPILLITTWRGAPDLNDEPQHRLMGSITKRLLDLLEISNNYFPETEAEAKTSFDNAARELQERQAPYAFILRKDTLAPYSLRGVDAPKNSHITAYESNEGPRAGNLLTCRAAIKTIVSKANKRALIVATTGKIARELYEIHDCETNFYVVGSMGCASSLALGIALYRPQRSVIVLDGDGAALMRLEAMASIGHYSPKNLIHIILDNRSYESTGGQKTQSSTVRFTQVAMGCNYRSVHSATSKNRLESLIAKLESEDGPHLIHLEIQPGSRPELKRPSISPRDAANRFRFAIASAAVTD